MVSDAGTDRPRGSSGARQVPYTLLSRHASALKRVVPPALRPRAYAQFYRALPKAGRATLYARRCRTAAEYCRRNGSPLYAHLLTVLADDIDARGVGWEVVKDYRVDGGVPPAANSRALMAAVHRIVLEEPGTALARHYPSAGGTVDLDSVGPAFLQVVGEHRDRVRELMTRPVQTNEVMRSRALLGGFLLAAARTGLPLRVLELGSSGGLNLRWDHYRYEVDGRAWGDPASPVRLVGGFSGGVPPLDLEAVVAERRGCDLAPLDAASRDGQLTLLSQVWPDQVDRVALLRGAFAVAERVRAPIDRADVLSWVRGQLADPHPDVCTVVFDTGVKEYLDPETLDALDRTIAAAGDRATAAGPIARLHVKPARGVPGVDGELELVVWPGGDPQTLAQIADPYAREVRWVA